MHVNVKETRQHFRSILDRVEKGEEITITRRGRAVARIVPAAQEKKLPPLDALRRSLSVSGQSLSQTVLDERAEG